MATLNNGIFGNFSGKLGKVIGYVDKTGKQRLRTIGERNYDNPSIGLQESWKKTAVVTDFLKPVMEFIRIGFAQKAKRKKISAYNVAFAENRNAVTGVFPEFRMDYSKVKFAAGDLQSAVNPEVIVTDEGLMFAWDNNWNYNNSKPTDLAMLMAYDPVEGQAFFLKAAASRKQGYAVLDLPITTNGQVLEAYIAFISDDHRKISNSTYLGQVIFNEAPKSAT